MSAARPGLTLAGIALAIPILFGVGVGIAVRAASPVTASPQTDPLTVQVAALTASVDRLTARVAAIEAVIGQPPAPQPVPVPTPPPAPATDTDPAVVRDYGLFLTGIEAGIASLETSVDTQTFDQAAVAIRAANAANHARLLSDAKASAGAAGIFNPDGTYRDATAAKAYWARFLRSVQAGRKGQ